MITIYGSLTCGKCKILAEKMDFKNIPYVKCYDYEVMNRLGISEIPILELNGGKKLNFFEANTWLNTIPKESGL